LIPKNNLLQITVPDDIEDFDIINYGYVGTWIIEKNAKKLNAWKQKIPNYEILGRIKDVTDGTICSCRLRWFSCRAVLPLLRATRLVVSTETAIVI
jgi:hypothetical protein